MAFPQGFLIGAATAAHQVEGNNINSDYWLQEHLPHSSFTEPSGEACDHYHRYEEDIKLLAAAGLNAYRFSVEWARIEPEEGKFDEREVEHYRDVIRCCKANGVEPIGCISKSKVWPSTNLVFASPRTYLSTLTEPLFCASYLFENTGEYSVPVDTSPTVFSS